MRDGKPIRNQALPSRRADHGPPERWRHAARTLEITEQAGVLAARVLEEHLLDRLVLAGLLDAAARDAGLRLRADYQAAHLESRVTASYAAARGLGQGGYVEYERSAVEEAAYQRWRNAVRALGPTESQAILTVCCYDAMPNKTAPESLRRGFVKLTKFYGL